RFPRQLHTTHLPSFSSHATSTSYIHTLSLHDALPISRPRRSAARRWPARRHVGEGDLPVYGAELFPAAARGGAGRLSALRESPRDRKSTRLNSSHQIISYAVFCLKKKKDKKK